MTRVTLVVVLCTILGNLGNSPVSVLVLANNNLGGCIPGSIGNMGKTLNEIILMNDNLTGWKHCQYLPVAQISKSKTNPSATTTASYAGKKNIRCPLHQGIRCV